MSLKIPDEEFVLVKKWEYLGGAICYKCKWECLITPAPNKCPECGNDDIRERFRGYWKKEPRSGFGIVCKRCKDSGRKGGGGRYLLKGVNYFSNVKIGEGLKCRLCGALFKKSEVRT